MEKIRCRVRSRKSTMPVLKKASLGPRIRQFERREGSRLIRDGERSLYQTLAGFLDAFFLHRPGKTLDRPDEEEGMRARGVGHTPSKTAQRLIARLWEKLHGELNPEE